MTLTASIKGTITHTHSNALDLSTPVDSMSMILTNAFTNGTGANKADMVWSDLRLLAASASEYIDLATLAVDAGTAPKDGLGGTWTALALKGLAIQLCDSAGAQITTTVATESLKVGGEGSTAAFQAMFHVSGTLSDTAGIVIAPGGTLIIIAPSAVGYAVAAGTNALLKIANPGVSDAYYKIWILAASLAA